MNILVKWNKETPIQIEHAQNPFLSKLIELSPSKFDYEQFEKTKSLSINECC